MTRWLLLCAVCALGYWLPVLIGPREGVLFFVDGAAWSLAALVAYLCVSTSRTALALAAIEVAAIGYVLACAWQYTSGDNWLYTGGAYSEVIRGLITAQIVVLAMGAPRNGIRRMVREFRGRDHHFGAAYRRGALDIEAN